MALGVIPGPTEPKGNINTFLKPIILWNGMPIGPNGNIVIAALLEYASSTKNGTVFGTQG